MNRENKKAAQVLCANAGLADALGNQVHSTVSEAVNDYLQAAIEYQYAIFDLWGDLADDIRDDALSSASVALVEVYLDGCVQLHTALASTPGNQVHSTVLEAVGGYWEAAIDAVRSGGFLHALLGDLDCVSEEHLVSVSVALLKAHLEGCVHLHAHAYAKGLSHES